MFVEPLEMLHGIFILLAIFLGWLPQFFVTFNFDDYDQITNFDEEVRTGLTQKV